MVKNICSITTASHKMLWDERTRNSAIGPSNLEDKNIILDVLSTSISCLFFFGIELYFKICSSHSIELISNSGKMVKLFSRKQIEYKQRGEKKKTQTKKNKGNPNSTLTAVKYSR